jgi:hypothetical protein
MRRSLIALTILTIASAACGGDWEDAMRRRNVVATTASPWWLSGGVATTGTAAIAGTTIIAVGAIFVGVLP